MTFTDQPISKEERDAELSVVQAALRWRMTGNADELLDACHALDRARTPQKTRTFEERWELAIQKSFMQNRREGGGGWNRPGISLEQFEKAVREYGMEKLEAAKWACVEEFCRDAIAKLIEEEESPDAR